MIMQHFPFHDFAEEMARTLKAVAHSAGHPRFFRATGPEEISSVEDRLSAISGTILIAVDGCESVTVPTTYDQLCERTTYHMMIVRQTNSDRRETIDDAVTACRALAVQVRNTLWQRYREVSRDVSLWGCGPLGDNFYGCGMTFKVDEYNRFDVDTSVFISPDESVSGTESGEGE